MGQSTQLEALSCAPPRKPLAVREHEIMRVSARLAGPLEPARKEVLEWAQVRGGKEFPAKAWAFQPFENLAGGRNCTGVRIDKARCDVWAIRVDDPDKTVPGRIWTTEVVVGLLEDQPPFLSTRLLVCTREEELHIEPHVPNLLPQVAEKCGIWCGPYRLTPEPWLIESESDSGSLVEMLLNSERRLPVFVLTVPEDSDDPNRPLLDASALSRATLGLAHVAVLPAEHTWALTKALGKMRSVYSGAVRAYLTDFSKASDPYSHRLVLAEHLRTPDGERQCTRWLRTLAARESVRRFRLDKDVLNFSTVRNSSLEFKQKKLKVEGASEREQLSAAMQRIKALEKQIEEEKASLEYFSNEHSLAEDRAEAAEVQSRAAAFRIQTLLAQLTANGEEPAGIALPDSWEDFANWCDVNLAGQVMLTPHARRSVRAPVFEDVELAARCLLWLATKGRDWFIGGGGGTIRDEPVEDGVRNAHCGSDQFDFEWQGDHYTADWHVKNGGNTREPRRCLRIYYCWDASTQQIVIADMPAHRRTGAS